jgi:hypothetical protein
MIIKSKTITATGYSRGAMEFDHRPNADGIMCVKYRQAYFFTGANGEAVPGLQNKYAVEGEIPDTELQAALPVVWSSLVFLFDWFDKEIKKQEGIT